MKWVAMMAMLAGLAAVAAGRATAADGLIGVTCPSKWPGPESRGAKLAYSMPWFDSRIPFGPDDTDVPQRQERSVLIDCAYPRVSRDSIYRTAASGFRLTVVVPGHTRRCVKPPFKSIRCDTAPAPDGSIGPIRIYIAERPTRATTLLGLGLGRSRDEIRAAAAESGLACADDPGSSAVLRCGGERGQLEVRFAGERSAAVRWLAPRDRPGEGGFYDRTVFRFGLGFSYVYDDPREPNLWQEPGSPVRVTFAGGADPMVLALEDLSAK